MFIKRFRAFALALLFATSATYVLHAQQNLFNIPLGTSRQRASGSISINLISTKSTTLKRKAISFMALPTGGILASTSLTCRFAFQESDSFHTTPIADASRSIRS
jgi:hypothetical protein